MSTSSPDPARQTRCPMSPGRQQLQVVSVACVSPMFFAPTSKRLPRSNFHQPGTTNQKPRTLSWPEGPRCPRLRKLARKPRMRERGEMVKMGTEQRTGRYQNATFSLKRPGHRGEFATHLPNPQGLTSAGPGPGHLVMLATDNIPRPPSGCPASPPWFRLGAVLPIASPTPGHVRTSFARDKSTSFARKRGPRFGRYCRAIDLPGQSAGIESSAWGLAHKMRSSD